MMRNALVVGVVAIFAALLLFRWPSSDGVEGGAHKGVLLGLENSGPTGDEHRIEVDGVGSRELEVGTELETANASDTDSKYFQVTVINRDTGSVSNAEVLLYSNGAVSGAGMTGPNGEPVLLLESTRGAVFARIDGMYSETKRLGSTGSRYLQIYVEPGGQISGTVVSGNGMPAPEGTAVLLWQGAEGAMASSAVLEALSGNPYYSLAVTDSAGAFSMRGLKRGVQYSLIAGGAGETCVKPTHGVVADGRGVILKMNRIYAALVRFRSEQSKGVVIPDGAARQCQFRTEPKGLSAGLTPLASWTLPLAGVSYRPGDADDGVQFPLAYSSESGEGQIGPFGITAHIPGYADVESDVFLPASFGGVVPDIDIRMDQLSEFDGVLTAHFVGAEHLIQGTENTRKSDIGRVFLSSYEGGQVYTFADFSDGAVRMENLPYGKYQLRFGVECAGSYLPFEYGATVTSIVGATPADVDLDCAPFAMTKLLVTDNSGNYNGPLTLLIKREGDVDRFVHFSHSPFDVPGLVEGSYSARVHLPTVLRSMRAQSFSLESGQVVTITFE